MNPTWLEQQCNAAKTAQGIYEEVNIEIGNLITYFFCILSCWLLWCTVFLFQSINISVSWDKNVCDNVGCSEM